jgi:cytoskeleton protein RodZ
MMKTLGETLEEARHNKGISIQEAAERTKIRVSFLEAFEKNDFDIKLPEIYRKGFVKNYAELLDLDADEIEAAYLRTQGRTGKVSRSKSNSSRENFGKLDLGSNNQPEPRVAREEPVSTRAPEPVAQSVQSVQAVQPTMVSGSERSMGESAPRKVKESQQNSENNPSSDKMIWAAVGVSFAALLVVVGFLAFMFRGNDTDTQTASKDQPAANSPASNPNNGGAAGPSGPSEPIGSPLVPEKKMGLEAKGGDVHVILIDKKTGGTIFDQTINDGESVEVSKTGPMAIIFDKGDHIYVRLDEKLYKMPKTGPGRTAIP